MKGLPLSKGYSVPPFQSGVFPVLQSLYAAWSDDVSDDGVHTTSSTLYHKNNDVGFLPLGFVYKNVQVKNKDFLNYNILLPRLNR